MYSIHLTFTRFDEIHLGALIGAIGVYVIWDSKAVARPTYVGEGTILERLASHAKRGSSRFAHPWTGYVAVLERGSANIRKRDAAIAECLLLHVAEDTDRLPTRNLRAGNINAVITRSVSEMVRVAVRGFDPLVAPWEAKRLAKTKEVKAWYDHPDGYEMDHDWRLRRLRQPF